MGNTNKLRKKVDALGVEISNVKRVEVSFKKELEIPNREGTMNSLQIYVFIANNGIIGPKEAKKGLAIYGDDLRGEAASKPGTYPSIDLLEEIVKGKVPPMNVNVVEFPEMETLTEYEELKIKEAVAEHGTNLYVCFEDKIIENVENLKKFPVPKGVKLIVRYAAKADPTPAIIRVMDKMGIYFDSCSFNETMHLLEKAKIDGKKIRQTSQEILSDKEIRKIVEQGVQYTASSLRQLESYGNLFPNTEVGIRFNVGIGSGWNNATTTGGLNASFGIYERFHEISDLLMKYNLTLETAHLHIGSGSDPEKQKQAALKGLELFERYSALKTLNLGGGIKVGRMNYEKSTDIQELGEPTCKAIGKYLKENPEREITIEIEPGTAVIATATYRAGIVEDMVTTGPKGRKFVKIDITMTGNARTPMYGAQHPLVPIPMDNSPRGVEDYIVVGTCCESGDVLTVRPGDPESIDERRMHEVKVGDLMVEKHVGAYCKSMSGHKYNQAGEPKMVMVRTDGRIDVVTEKQPPEDLSRYERIPKDLMLDEK